MPDHPSSSAGRVAAKRGFYVPDERRRRRGVGFVFVSEVLSDDSTVRIARALSCSTVMPGIFSFSPRVQMIVSTWARHSRIKVLSLRLPWKIARCG